jgi:hypothetical protein
VIAAAGEELSSSRLNRVYEGSFSDFEAIGAGLLEVRLSAPRFEIELREHRLSLVPRSDGGHDFELMVDFEGHGLLLAELDLLGLPGAMEDKVILPSQTRRLAGRLKIEPEVEGYRVTLLEAPSHLELAVESRLGEELIKWCGSMPLLSAGCDALEGGLSRLRIPLPPAGSRHLIGYELLTPDERVRIDAVLAAPPE